MTVRLKRWFDDYDAYHRHPGNKVTHYLGIPMILITLLGLLAGVELGPVDAGLAVWAAASLWYFTLDWKIALPFSLLALGGYFLGKEIPASWAWGLFVAGWILQFVGHYCYEKRSPAFFSNLLQTLIGPLWIFSRLVGYHR